MLVLSRGDDEAVIITVGEVEIRVLAVHCRHGKVRLGFVAPPEVVIHREEVRLGFVAPPEVVIHREEVQQRIVAQGGGVRRPVKGQ